MVLSLKDSSSLSKSQGPHGKGWEGTVFVSGSAPLPTGLALLLGLSLPRPISCRNEPAWGSQRAACSGEAGRGVVPISAVMRLIKSLASWPGRAEQGPKSWRKRDFRISNSSLFYRSYKNGNLQSSLGVAPLDARASETIDVKRLAQFLAHGRHLINGASITIIIAPVSSGRGTRRPGRVPQLMSGPGSFLAGGLSCAG